jgi:hypothetical protein
LIEAEAQAMTRMMLHIVLCALTLFVFYLVTILFRMVFGLDLDPPVIVRIRTHLGLPTRVPPRAPAQ